MDAASPLPTARALTPANHLRLALLHAVLALLLRATQRVAPLDALATRFPATQRWLDRAAAAGLEGCTLEAGLGQLSERLWDTRTTELPLARLRRALDLSTSDVDAWLLCAAADEDPALGDLLDVLGGHEGRATPGLLGDAEGLLPEGVHRLREAGFLREAAAGRWRTWCVPPAVWEAVQGRAAACTDRDALPQWSDLVLPPHVRETAEQALARHAPQRVCWVLPGGSGSGRRTLAGALARSAGFGLLGPSPGTDPAELAACAVLLGAMPLADFSPSPGERVDVPAFPWLPAPVAVRVPRDAAVAAAGRVACSIELALPDRLERERHWQLALAREPEEAVVDLRLPRGWIHRLAAQAGGSAVAVAAHADAQCRHRLEGLAHRVPPPGASEELALSDGAQQEFDLLVARCRHREALPELLPAAFGHAGSTGVRALFKGASGTGKTLAARHLAAALGRPLYRVDLAATVSKYIGETERNLERVFAAAEELDVVLLLDEGDALMAGRTAVANANDRYANLETNYLLQRVERHGGLLVVTTNLPERIDPAFARRMDATLEFPLPDAVTRYRLWRAHLPAGHGVDEPALEEVARRCALSGGQVRNAALHASLLALEQGAALHAHDLGAALRREYARAGLACPSLSFA
ncbi:ATP-binding protein [Ramlibacter sp. USB13]|uniref:ATP-binding protein n=1 Tax=Ramlibacter cellulosilyticus TaxID=2764187 RepID=A0A923MSL8_9BURK|nr:ATP-binding protein [Ramlibacter cellulosilyticus]MBC5783439.1 ATP-binding protein [Ramlibacter cellulosilyticus]